MRSLACIAIFILFVHCARCQSRSFDTAYIARFQLRNVVEFSPGIYNARFNFYQNNMRQSHFKMVANSSAYASAYVSYKWLSVNYSFNMPGTRLDNDIRFQYFSVRFRFGNRHMIFRPFFTSYNGLLIPEQRRNNYASFKNMHFNNLGIDYYYLTNTKKYSFRAASSFLEKQKKNVGTALIMVTPSWQQLRWNTPSRTVIKDSLTYALLSQSPRWISLIHNAGYSYNVSLGDQQWLVAATVMGGLGGVTDLTSPQNKVHVAYHMAGWLNAGYNGDKYYAYANFQWDEVRTNLLIRNMRHINTDISLTGGFRFGSLSKKIWRVL